MATVRRWRQHGRLELRANNNAGSTCTLAIGAVAAGGSNQTATYAVTVVNPVAAGVTQISNTASISDDNTNGINGPTVGSLTVQAHTPAGSTTHFILDVTGYFK